MSKTRFSAAVPPPTVLRQASVIERVGEWFLFSAVLALGFALVLADRRTLLALPPDPASVYWLRLQWTHFFAGVAIVTGTLSITPRWLPNQRKRRYPLLVAIAMASVIAGVALQERIGSIVFGAPIEYRSEQVYARSFVILTTLAVLIVVLFEFRRLHRQSEATVHRELMLRLRLEEEIAASRLHVLQAQVEPHFIFNSLANVRRLLRTDADAGRAMLDDILRYLRSALPRLRDQTPTLREELELVRALLSVHQVRMGARLVFKIDVPPTLLDRSVPPMMLLTLVENALKHGLAPLPEGGTIWITAVDDDGGRLRLSVSDDGRGLDSEIGHGMGLANIQARLYAMFGPRASMTLEVNDPRGVVATLILPDSTEP